MRQAGLFDYTQSLDGSQGSPRCLIIRLFKRRITVIMGFMIAGIIAIIMLIFLIYAMFNPEKF
jgi:K+-transporting ATPase KdpF subunit